MKRFLVFAGANYYPQPGWEDFRGSFDDQIEAIDAVDKMRKSYADRYDWDWWQIVDTTTGKIVATGNS